MKIIIHRRYLSECTLGSAQAYDDSDTLIFSFKTLELPWKNNVNKISCIPEGIYKIKKEKHKKFGECFRIQDVSGRYGILIHNGNYTRQILGCILVGEKHIDIDNDGIVDVTNSVNTLKKLTDLIPDGADLIISHFD